MEEHLVVDEKRGDLSLYKRVSFHFTQEIGLSSTKLFVTKNMKKKIIIIIIRKKKRCMAKGRNNACMDI